MYDPSPPLPLFFGVTCDVLQHAPLLPSPPLSIYSLDTLPPTPKNSLICGAHEKYVLHSVLSSLSAKIIIPAFQFPTNGRANIVFHLAWSVFLFHPFPITIRRRHFCPATASNAFIVNANAHLLIQLPKNVPDVPRGTSSVISSFPNRAAGMISPPKVIFIQRPPRIVLHHSLPTVLRETAFLTHC